MVIGGAGLLAGCLLPWASGVDPGVGATALSGFDGAGDGSILMVLALAVIGLVRNRSVAQSRLRTLQLLPLVIAAAMAFILTIALRSTISSVDRWVAEGGSGSIEPGMWLTAAGVLAMASGTWWIAFRRSRRVAAETPPLRDEWGVSVGGLLEAAGGAAGAVAGLAAGIVIATSSASSWNQGVLFLLATGGLVAGAGAGTWLARRAAGWVGRGGDR